MEFRNLEIQNQTDSDRDFNRLSRLANGVLFDAWSLGRAVAAKDHNHPSLVKATADLANEEDDGARALAN